MLKKFWALTMALIMVTAALAGCGKKNSQSAQAVTPAPQQEDSIIEVIAVLAAIASTDWKNREEEGKDKLANLLLVDQEVINKNKIAAANDEVAATWANTYEWTLAHAQWSVMTTEERAAKKTGEFIGNAEELLYKGRETLDGILNGSKEGGD